MVMRADTGRLPLANAAAADGLDRAARTLEARGENPYRVKAYRTAADTVRGLPGPASDLLRDGGRKALTQLPGIGDRLAYTLEQLLLTGHVQHVEGLGDKPEELLATVSGVGPGLARRIHDAIQVETLEDLERAAHDGRLAAVPGMGEKRLRGVREALAGRFRRPVGGPPASPPPIGDVLAVDAAYRERADAGLLRRVAPRRFNPHRDAWLPVLRTRAGGVRYRALYSNTEAAHRLGRTRDWVVVYYTDAAGATGQCTVVTEGGNGPLAGKRVVRGREGDVARFYGVLPPVAVEQDSGLLRGSD